MQLYPKLILDALAKVRYPGNGKDLVANEMIEDDIRIDGNKVSFSIIFDKPTDPFIRSVVKAAETAILTFVSPEVNIKGNIAVKARQTARPNPENPLPDVKNIIAVSSGKGGVGKSFVTASLANRMAQKGYKVGILDADITGPSIPKMYGVKGPAQAVDAGIYPIEAKNGIKVMSVNLLLPREDEPVIWRGPILANMVKQFWTDIVWGEIVYLFVDMPPGTGDVPLTVMQGLPLDGIVIVSSPQDLVGIIVEKAVKMARMMKVPVLSLVENMSYFICPDCGKVHEIFGESKVQKLAAIYGIDAFIRLPINPDSARLVDEGRVEDIDCDYVAALADTVLR